MQVGVEVPKMHSPGASSTSVAVRGPGQCVSLDRASVTPEPSNKILHSLLYNFAHSGYLSNSSIPAESRVQSDFVSRTHRNEEQLRQNTSEYPRFRNQHHERLSPQRQYNNRSHTQLSPHPGEDATIVRPRHFPHHSVASTSQSHSHDSSGNPYAENYLSPRHRSSSIGSAGSSFRDSRSPSHDSTTSHDSLSRCSPLSISPSPSPPSPESSSKLLGILKGGSYAYPYAGILAKRNSVTHFSQEPPSANSHIAQRKLSCTSESSVGSSYSSYHSDSSIYKEDGTYSRHGTPTDKRNNHMSGHCQKRDITACQDEPIDLSCKPKRRRTDSGIDPDSPLPPEDKLSWSSSYYSVTPRDEIRASTESNNMENIPKKSILESILCGNPNMRPRSATNSPHIVRMNSSPEIQDSFRNVTRQLSHDDMLKRAQSPMSMPTSPIFYQQSPISPSYASDSVPASPTLSTGSHFGLISKSRCPWRQRVTLAKKNLLPVSARVTDWLQKVIDFSKSQPEFSSLPDCDKVTLIQGCWTRLMLLYMAETNFQFAVTPVHEDSGDQPPAITGIDPSEPTMDSVESLQNFIKKCQNLALESKEYHCLRMVTLFHPGCCGLENSDFVDKISSQSRQILKDHVCKSRPDEKLRYSNLLLCLHTLFGVNCGMVQTLFCQHVTKNGSLDDQLRKMVLTHKHQEESAPTE